MNEVIFNNLLRKIEFLTDDFKALSEKFRTGYKGGYTSLEYQNTLQQAFVTANDGERNINLSPDNIGLAEPALNFISECFSLAKENKISFRECFRKRFYSCNSNEIAERLYVKLYKPMLSTIKQTNMEMAKRFEKDYSEKENVFRMIEEAGSVLNLADLDLFAETGDTLSFYLEASENDSFKISAFIIDIKENTFADNPYIFKIDKENAVVYLVEQQGHTIQELADGMNKSIYNSDFIGQLANVLDCADTSKELQLRLLVMLDEDGAGTLDLLTENETAVIENAVLALTENGTYKELIYSERPFAVPVSMIKTKKGS